MGGEAGAEAGETQGGCECVQSSFGDGEHVPKGTAVRDAQLEHVETTGVHTYMNEVGGI